MTIELLLVIEFRGEILRLWASKPSIKPRPYQMFWESDDAEEYVELFEQWLSPEGRLPWHAVPGDALRSVKDSKQLEMRGAKTLWADWMKEEPPFGLPREKELPTP